MKDFLGNDLELRDFVLINQNTRTGSSTVRKMLKECTITGFTKCKVKTTCGDVFSDDVIKIFYKNNEKIDIIKQAKESIKDV